MPLFYYIKYTAKYVTKIFQLFKIEWLLVSPTCFWVDREEILRVASSDAITQTTGRGSEVRVLRLDTDDGYILWRVLHDDWVVDRIRGEGSIIIDIFYLRDKEGRRKKRGWGRIEGKRGQGLGKRQEQAVLFVSILTVICIWVGSDLAIDVLIKPSLLNQPGL